MIQIKKDDLFKNDNSAETNNTDKYDKEAKEVEDVEKVEETKETSIKKTVKMVSFLLDGNVKEEDSSSNNSLLKMLQKNNTNDFANSPEKKIEFKDNTNSFKYASISNNSNEKEKISLTYDKPKSDIMHDYKDCKKDSPYEIYDKREYEENDQKIKISNDLNVKQIKSILRVNGQINSLKNGSNYKDSDSSTNEGTDADGQWGEQSKSADEEPNNNERINFEQSYNESLKNYMSSSFVDMLNTLQKNKQNNTNDVDTSNQLHQIKNEDQNIINPSTNYQDKDFSNEIEPTSRRIIQCILCGDNIISNNSKMCNNCLLQSIESNSTNINRDSYLIYYCRECKRYLHNKWVFCELESKELLALCLKKVPKLKKLKILDSKFLYTEPHSKRIKIHITVQEELINNFVSEMEFILHYVIKYTQCDDCKKKYTPYTYNTCVSVRQKVDHKKTLLFLESLLLKSQMNENIINIVSNPDGLDFHFLSRTDALKFCDFILSKTMAKCKNSKHLINHDANNNTYNYLYSFSIDICPICKHDLIFFPKNFAIKYGIKSTFYLCMHVSIYIILVDPFGAANNVYISQERYNKYPFLSLLNKNDAKSFLVLNVEHISSEESSKKTNTKKENNIKKRKKKRHNRDNSDISDMGESTNANDGFNEKINKNKRKTKSIEDSESNYSELHKVIEYESSEDQSYNMSICQSSLAGTKSCKSSTRKVKLEKLSYAYVELYDESNGSTILTKSCNARHLFPGDYVNAYDLRKHSFDSDINLYLEENDNYNIIIIDKVKSKEIKKIEDELHVQNKNIETLKNVNDDEDIFNRIVHNNCLGLENLKLTSS
ncbi:60S ribosomal export protein NMD3, putative [Plasmodium chabaudi chabaudi]|uniref:60S ribosomal export protein NMD3, putative n=1 Tax=Plasmodium chabaudi chabaudi TaxID=31271 RepID=A0A1C6X240_PLACU|nr:60S ribosomal export protein NMD3, putative [Plasmodium chabaudi chabaudi]